MTPAAVRTESVDATSVDLDIRSDGEILSTILDGQRRAINSLEAAIPSLSRAAQLAVEALDRGGRLVYLGAGSAALMSLADALEIPQTYGIARDRIVMIFADGRDIATRLNGAREDDGAGARIEIAGHKLGSGDCVVAISASGATPYTVHGLDEARVRGAKTIAIAGNAGAPLFQFADVPVLLDVGPEVIAGSTRMGAGTAQKSALNMLSTLVGIRLGHVYDGLMVNVKADNEKLRGRAARIVTTITGASAEQAPAPSSNRMATVKAAILIAAGAKSLADAVRLLGAAKGHVRAALGKLGAERWTRTLPQQAAMQQERIRMTMHKGLLLAATASALALSAGAALAAAGDADHRELAQRRPAVWKDKIIPAFEKAHPDIKVMFPPTAPTEYNAALNAKLAGRHRRRHHRLPAVRRLAGLFKKGQLADVNDLPGMDNFSDVAKAAWPTDDGKTTFCVPMASVLHGFIYNKDAFDKVGITDAAEDRRRVLRRPRQDQGRRHLHSARHRHQRPVGSRHHGLPEHRARTTGTARRAARR